MWLWLTFWRPPCLLRAVLVTLVSDKDTAIQGVLWQSRGAWLVIRDGWLHEPRAAPRKVDGEIVIHRSNVAFMQVPPR